MTELEERIRAKIPGPDTGITVKHTMCDICTPGPQCGIDAYIKDGTVIKIEGTKGFPGSNGKLCTKGASNRQYLYREDRIKTPMRRVGPRGEGKFEPISWEEAYALAARELNRIKAAHGPESVAFVCGYSKWFRPFLQRLAFSFGSPNYMTESSACFRATVVSNKCVFGHPVIADLSRTKLFVAWGSNPFINMYPLGGGLVRFKENGGRVIVIDPRNTQSAQKLADLYLRPRLGTDGALAHAMARVILENGWQDQDFLDRYVHGFEAYRDYVMGFDLETAERITGVPAEDIRRAAELFATTDPSVISPSNAITHRTNGFNNHRAIQSLMVITGRFDRPGTALPDYETYCHSNGGFASLEEEFVDQVRPKTDKKGVGRERFPLWADMVDEAQGMDLANQILSGKPYPLKAGVLLGVNTRMYPDTRRFVRALDQLDFILADDIFWTEACRHADLVLPASTSFERSEVKCYAGKFINYTKPVIPPVHDNRDDARIICELASALGLDDPLLRSGYDKCLQYIMSPGGIQDWDAFRAHDGPIPVPNARPYVPGTYLKEGPRTPTGKLELYSEAVAKYRDRGLDPLPVYADSDDRADPEEYPFVFCTGARLPNAVHTRVHKCSWPRALRQDASVDLHPEDAARLGVKQGDWVEIATAVNRIRVKANVTQLTQPGEVHMYHGYEEANVNGLIHADHLDPYTGFPGYKQFRCRLTKCGEEAEA
mgnify:CR=1 FL=1